MGRAKTASKYSLIRVAVGQLTHTEYQGIKSAAKEAGVSPSTYMRNAIFKAAKVTPSYERASWDHARKVTA